MGVIRIIAPDESTMFGTTVGTVDDTYAEPWLTDSSQNRPVAVTGSPYFVVTALSAIQADVVALLGHNVPATGTITIGGSITDTIPTAAWGRDGIPKGWYRLLAAPVSVSTLTLSVTGGPATSVLGEFIAGLSHEVGFLEGLKFSFDDPLPWEGEASSLAPYDPGVSQGRHAAGQLILSAADATILIGINEATRNGSRPILIIWDDEVNDIWLATMKISYEKREKWYFTDVTIDEIRRVRYPA